MRVGKSMTIAAAEGLLSGIVRTANARARIPTRGQHNQAGGEAAVVQALITWAQASTSCSLQTFVPTTADPDGQIEALTRQFFGLSAALLCDNAFAIDGSSVFESLRAAAFQRLELLQSEKARDASRGAQYEVLCVDHLDKAGPRILYDLDAEEQPVLKGPESFVGLAEIIQNTVVPPELARGISSDFAAALGGALYELFRNTQDHARVDDAGDKLVRSLRGIQARRHAIAQNKLVELTVASPPLAEFCSRLRPPRSRNRDVQLIEISVVDSGPGYAAAMGKRPAADLTIQDEADLVRQCFLKHATSKDRSRSGLGLCNVVDILREHGGFLRLRTGRQSLYADLGLEAGSHYGTLPDLRDWPIEGGQTPHVSGSLMTILLPLVIEQ